MDICKLSIHDLDLKSLKVNIPPNTKLRESFRLEFCIPLKIPLEIDKSLTRTYSVETDSYEYPNVSIILSTIEGTGIFDPYFRSINYKLHSVKGDIFSIKDRQIITDLVALKVRDYYYNILRKFNPSTLSNHNFLLNTIEGFVHSLRPLSYSSLTSISQNTTLNELDNRKLDLEKYKPNDIYYRRGNKCLLCIIRKKLILLTPE